MPPRVRAIARAVRRKNPGWPLSRCIAVAINAVKYSAATGDSKLPGRQNERPDTVAAHQAAAADWAAKKASAHAHTAHASGAVLLAEHQPYRYRHGWIPLGTEVHDLKRVRDRKALMADTPDEVMRSVIDNRGGDKIAVYRNERNEIIGAANFTRDRYSKENALIDMRVDREARGRGAGHKLISAVAQDAQAQSKGKSDWGLNVTNALASAIPFYAQTGATFRNENSSVGYWDAAATNAAAAGTHIDNRPLLTPKQIREGTPPPRETSLAVQAGSVPVRASGDGPRITGVSTGRAAFLVALGKRKKKRRRRAVALAAAPHRPYRYRHGWIPLVPGDDGSGDVAALDRAAGAAPSYAAMKARADRSAAKKAPTSRQPPSYAYETGEVGDSITRRGKFSPGQDEALTTAVTAIEKVHHVGALPKLSVRTKLLDEGTYGEFGDENRPHIELTSAISPHQAMTAVHEIGHYLDKEGLGESPDVFATSAAKADQDWGSPMGGFLLAAYGSDTLRDVTDTANGNSPYDDAGLYRAYASYLGAPREVWARAYAQYIANQSQEPQLLAELHDAQKMDAYEPLGMPHQQWPDAEFEPISSAIADILARQGWLHADDA